MSRRLVVAAHGTASPAGRRVVEDCAAAAAAELGVHHAVGYVDVCGPTLEEVLAGAADPVVVPLFLATGYHVRHDVPAAVGSVPGAVVTPALGTDPEVVTALEDRVLEASLGLAGRPVAPAGAGLAPAGPRTAPAGPRAAPAGPRGRLRPDAVVVTAAGSSVKGARAEVATVAELLAARLGAATGTAYLTGPGPRPAEEVERLRADGHEHVVLATHLLAPGHFADRARETAAALGTVASEELGTHPAIVDLVVRRYREASA